MLVQRITRFHWSHACLREGTGGADPFGEMVQSLYAISGAMNVKSR